MRRGGKSIRTPGSLMQMPCLTFCRNRRPLKVAAQAAGLERRLGGRYHRRGAWHGAPRGLRTRSTTESTESTGPTGGPRRGQAWAARALQRKVEIGSGVPVQCRSSAVPYFSRGPHEGTHADRAGPPHPKGALKLLVRGRKGIGGGGGGYKLALEWRVGVAPPCLYSRNLSRQVRKEFARYSLGAALRCGTGAAMGKAAVLPHFSPSIRIRHSPRAHTRSLLCVYLSKGLSLMVSRTRSPASRHRAETTRN